MPIIECHKLSKRYEIDRANPAGAYRYRTVREEIGRWARALWARARGSRRENRADFWALADVDFTVQPGEVVGVIGRNGAGKSTLLKILSRITRPTSGWAILHGRVGSLLEVGTGFHPELTGRENIYLNGAILGMKRSEIARKFDPIVAFAEIEPFLDMPVKRYSSGMFVRLAFAVAAHLEPEILIVDEVLAVGDLAFQRKCLGRMKEVGRSGATVLFVSHSMPAIETLCTRVLLLDEGRVAGDGNVRDLIREYHRRTIEPQGLSGVNLADRVGPDRRIPVFQSVRLLDSAGEPTNFIPLGGAFRFRIGLESRQTIHAPTITIAIDDTLGHRLISLCTPLTDPILDRLEGVQEIECLVRQFPLAPGDYWIKLGLATPGMAVDEIERVLHFSVTNADAFGEGRGIHRGLCVAPSHWSIASPSVSPPQTTSPAVVPWPLEQVRT